MAVKTEDLYLSHLLEGSERALIAVRSDSYNKDAIRQGLEPESMGSIEVEIIDGNVVVTVSRIDEAYFGPVSLVVV